MCALTRTTVRAMQVTFRGDACEHRLDRRRLRRPGVFSTVLASWFLRVVSTRPLCEPPAAEPPPRGNRGVVGDGGDGGEPLRPCSSARRPGHPRPRREQAPEGQWRAQADNCRRDCRTSHAVYGVNRQGVTHPSRVTATACHPGSPGPPAHHTHGTAQHKVFPLCFARAVTSTEVEWSGGLRQRGSRNSSAAPLRW